MRARESGTGNKRIKEDEAESRLFLGENQPYLRPCLCRGNFREAGIILSGINPATPIYPSEVPLEEYCRLLRDYPSFMGYYRARRIKENKPALSRTRQGIESFVKWAERELKTGVIESDVCTYPTASVKELLKADKRFLKAGRDMFWEVLCRSEADCLILYGVKAFRDFLVLQEEKGGFIREKGTDKKKLMEMKVEELEAGSPFLSLWTGKREISVYVARHFMYYGREGLPLRL